MSVNPEPILNRTDLRKIEDIVDSRQSKNTSRTGLYLMVGVVALTNLHMSSSLNKHDMWTDRVLNDLESQAQEIQPQRQMADVIGESEMDEFYVLRNGKDTAYVVIDGIPVEEYHGDSR